MADSRDEIRRKVKDKLRLIGELIENSCKMGFPFNVKCDVESNSALGGALEFTFIISTTDPSDPGSIMGTRNVVFRQVTVLTEEVMKSTVSLDKYISEFIHRIQTELVRAAVAGMYKMTKELGVSIVATGGIASAMARFKLITTESLAFR